MAKFELKFIDAVHDMDFIKVNVSNQITDINTTKDCIEVSGIEAGKAFQIILDKSTAIKFAKTLRTEINKITELERRENGYKKS